MAPFIALFVVYWALTGGDYLLRTVTGSSQPAPATSAPTVSPGEDLAYAKEKLREVAPNETYNSIANMDTPKVQRVDGTIRYTWEYRQRTANNAVEVHTFTLILTPEGTFGGIIVDAN